MQFHWHPFQVASFVVHQRGSQFQHLRPGVSALVFNKKKLSLNLCGRLFTARKRNISLLRVYFGDLSEYITFSILFLILYGYITQNILFFMVILRNIYI